MAIKGKKKPQSRGSAARRRPAAPPRLAYVKQVHVPWYRTAGGRVASAVGVVVVIAAVAFAITSYNANNNEEQARRDKLDAFTSSVRTLLEQVVEPASAMAAFPPQPDDRAVKGLSEEATKWDKALTAAGRSARNLEPPGGLEGTGSLFFESIRLYSIAARTYEVGGSADGETQRNILMRAREQTQAATSIWTDAVYLLDQERNDAGMSASQILSPPLAGSAP
jgi:hypothetical protein